MNNFWLCPLSTRDEAYLKLILVSMKQNQQ